MGPFEIAAIALIGGFAISGYKEFNKRHAREDSKEIESLRSELDKLKSRVNTLETIVTDKSYQLGDEIARL
ncbi:hypothetical protein LZP69_01265 [Shewanella sp. AS1]|uniref:hypothetical protein n=1 Tax=Shewanella sp. AS1 TaxID=2907626 RepID=UPI001F2801A8|nr:hypothetical protein [Shewanella sp. AS1]MCE9677821.1 hypothetical protein [Shewanella sp. AS1]